MTSRFLRILQRGHSVQSSVAWRRAKQSVCKRVARCGYCHADREVAELEAGLKTVAKWKEGCASWHEGGVEGVQDKAQRYKLRYKTQKGMYLRI